MIEIRSGNLFDSKSHALVNAVNTVGVMGKGIAKAFATRYPDMLADYQKRCMHGDFQMGEPYAYPVKNRLIINFPTKKHWRDKSDLSAIEAGLGQLSDLCFAWNIRSISTPALGCGEGGLEWDDVRPLMVRHLATLGIPVYLYEPVLPRR